MKKCSYCGRKNKEDSTHCYECGQVLVPVKMAMSEEVDDQNSASSTDSPRFRPRFIIVAGFWALFLPGLIGNMANLITIPDRATGYFHAVLLSLGSLTGCVICVYVLRTSAKNYLIQRQRAKEERAAEAISESSVIAPKRLTDTDGD